MPVADCGVFEVGERSEVGVLESSHNVNEVNHQREAKNAKPKTRSH